MHSINCLKTAANLSSRKSTGLRWVRSRVGDKVSLLLYKTFTYNTEFLTQ